MGDINYHGATTLIVNGSHIQLPSASPADGESITYDTATGRFIWSTGGGGVTDHGALTGLADDDHSQYHTDARGDARYSQLGHTHAYASLTGLPTLGSAAALDVGTAALEVVQLDGTAKLPAVDGSQLTNLPGGALTIGDGISGGTANRILFEDASNNLAESANLTVDASGNIGATNVRSSATTVYVGGSTGWSSVAIGNASDTSTRIVRVGIGGSSASRNYGVAVGFNCSLNGDRAVCVAFDSSASADSVAIGHQTSASSGQIVISNSFLALSNMFIGKGASHATPSAVTYNGTGGSGTNIAGGNVTIAGGRGTGTGNGGDVNLSVAEPGASGSSQNALVAMLTVRGSDGLIVVDVPTADPVVSGALWNDSGTLKISAG